MDQPNPYNAPEYLPEDLDPELACFLTNAPWNETVRRFLNQQAVFIATGGWDASSLFTGAEGMFTAGDKEAPMPIKGERGFEFFAGYPSEAERRLGVPPAIFNRSRTPPAGHSISSITSPASPPIKN